MVIETDKWSSSFLAGLLVRSLGFNVKCCVLESRIA